MATTARGIPALGAILVLGLGLSACGKQASTGKHSSTGAAPGPGASAVVIQVGKTPITRALYRHWLAIGVATVNIPLPGQPIPKAIAYEPPDFKACVASLQKSSPPKQKPTTAELKLKCQQTFVGIKQRILSFLITGYWIRGEAAERGVTVSDAEVQQKFEENKRQNYPTPAAFQELLASSHQTIPDLKFAVETQLLSAKLLKNFTTSKGKGKAEQELTIPFNQSIELKWSARTDCRQGFVVKDCKQYRPAA